MGVAYICRGMAMVPEPMHMTMHGGGGGGGGGRGGDGVVWCDHSYS